MEGRKIQMSKDDSHIPLVTFIPNVLTDALFEPDIRESPI